MEEVYPKLVFGIRAHSGFSCDQIQGGTQIVCKDLKYCVCDYFYRLRIIIDAHICWSFLFTGDVCVAQGVNHTSD